jgi:hypothetical protein
MTPVDFGTIVTTAFGDFADNLVGAAPALLAIGLVAFGVPFVWNWAKRLVS